MRRCCAFCFCLKKRQHGLSPPPPAKLQAMAQSLSLHPKTPACSPCSKMSALVGLESRRCGPSRTVRGGSRCGVEDGRGCGGGRVRQWLDRDARAGAVGARARHGAEAGNWIMSRHCHRSSGNGNAGEIKERRRLLKVLVVQFLRLLLLLRTMGRGHSPFGRPAVFRSLPNIIPCDGEE